MSYTNTSKDILSFLDTIQPMPFHFEDLQQNHQVNNELTVDAKPYFPAQHHQVEIEEINHTIPMPKGFRKCSHFENCEKSECSFVHELTWYKKDNHYLRIYNEHQKEVDHILKYRIRTFPKLISTYDEQCKYHKKMTTLAKHYAEINCNDVSYLSLDFNNSRKNRKNYKLEEYIPKNSKEEHVSILNTNLFMPTYEQEPVENASIHVAPKSQNKGVFRLNENRDRNDYKSSWRN